MTVKLLFLAGSARQESLNKKLAKYAHTLAEKEDDIEATFIDLKDYPMPIYDGDWEDGNGLPENALKLKKYSLMVMAFLLPTLNIIVHFHLF